MDQLLINAVGAAAGLCSISSFIPQIIKIWRDKDASGVSLVMFGVTMTTFALWCVYGWMLQSWPIALSNALCFVLATIILLLRLKFGDESSKKSATT